MSKKIRQITSICLAIISYYIIHEGAHLLFALSCGIFKQINFMKLGIQIDIYEEYTTKPVLGFFVL